MEDAGDEDDGGFFGLRSFLAGWAVEMLSEELGAAFVEPVDGCC